MELPDVVFLIQNRRDLIQPTIHRLKLAATHSDEDPS